MSALKRNWGHGKPHALRARPHFRRHWRFHRDAMVRRVLEWVNERPAELPYPSPSHRETLDVFLQDLRRAVARQLALPRSAEVNRASRKAMAKREAAARRKAKASERRAS